MWAHRRLMTAVSNNQKVNEFAGGFKSEPNEDSANALFSMRHSLIGPNLT